MQKYHKVLSALLNKLFAIIGLAILTLGVIHLLTVSIKTLIISATTNTYDYLPLTYSHIFMLICSIIAFVPLTVDAVLSFIKAFKNLDKKLNLTLAISTLCAYPMILLTSGLTTVSLIAMYAYIIFIFILQILSIVKGVKAKLS